MTQRPPARPPAVIERRAIRGASAVLLPYTPGGIDWAGFEAHLAATATAGLTPAVNMDTGYGPALDGPTRARVLEVTRRLLGPGAPWIAGAHVADRPGDALDHDATARACAEVAAAGGVPILFPSHGLAALDEPDLVAEHERIAGDLDALWAFELGAMFHPAGRILSIEAFAAVIAIPAVVGLKHSSLDRAAEWARLDVVASTRPGFGFATGNDLAIDLVTLGSDYLLGLSTFHPEAFAARDEAWERGDHARFWALNDVLQYLGQFAFRPPVPAYRHDAAMFLRLRGRIDHDLTHPASPQRPDADRAVLADIAARIDELL